ncbi:hypothetical protein GCM10010472_03170 [Pseudonocardia halophobica]|uniref:Uncharacterized protein n=1 Tax=Pseudonocardia halophobica TaxID=29401 RepID=A0A9W6L0F3_9PSEU|nr:Rv3235 family protein [Pseudonocardia halophobica]GLL10657.1 hypothetical protein GCM10017577_17970 [Pseudonocardia halophobica]
MSTALDQHEEHTQDLLRRALGLPVRRPYIWDGQDLHAPCVTCGHQSLPEHTRPIPQGTPVVDFVPDLAALRTAAVTTAMVVEVIDRRRPRRHIRDQVTPEVLRYIEALPTDGHGMRGGARLLRLHARQPHRGAVEVAATIRLAGRLRAVAASFGRSWDGQWQCESARVL